MSDHASQWPFLVINGAWLLLQLELVRVTLRDRVPALPLPILPAELAWAFYGLLHLGSPSPLGRAFAVVWAAFAAFSAWLVGRYVRASWYWPLLAAAAAVCYAGHVWLLGGRPDAARLYHDWVGPLGTAGWSAAFLLMLLRRDDLRGQSLPAWGLRVAGFDAVLLGLGAAHGSGRLLGIGAAAAALDAAFLVVYLRRARREMLS